MTFAQLETIGKLMHGRNWKTPLARQLGITARAINTWKRREALHPMAAAAVSWLYAQWNAEQPA